jgi:NDP-sugar pyrophosphorylase family protein
MATLAEQGIKNFIFGEYGFTNYSNLFDQFGEGVGFSAKYDIKPRVHIKHQPNFDDLGSADSYRLNMQYYDVKDPVLVVQGDDLFELDVNDFMKTHQNKKAAMTIALTAVGKVEEFGVADLDSDMRIKKFIEKPPAEKAPSNFANAGIYMLSPEVRKIVESQEVKKIMDERHRLDFGFDFIPYLVDNGFPVYGYKLKVWYDIGSPERYLSAMIDVLHGKLNIRIREERILSGRNIWVQGYSDESDRTRKEIINKHNQDKLQLDGAVLIGRHTHLGDFTRLSDSNVDNFCTVGEHSIIERSAVMDAVKVGDYARVSDSIIGRKAVVESTREKPTRIELTSVIGSGARVTAGCTLIGTRVNPGLTIPQGMTYIDKFLQNYEDVVHMSTNVLAP